MSSYLRKNGYHTITIIVLLLITVWGMYLRYERRKSDLWVDELYQIRSMNISLAATLADSRMVIDGIGDYLLIYPFYKLFGDNKWGLAVPHIIVTILGFYLFYILCSKYFRVEWTYIVTFSIFAANYTLIRHAFEIRPYTVLVTLSIATFIVMQYIFEKESVSMFKRILIAMFIGITFLFHTFGMVILFFSYIFHLIVSRNSRSARDLFFKHLKYYGWIIVISFPIWWYTASNYLPRLIEVKEDTFMYSGKGIIGVLKAIFGNLTGQKVFYLLLPGIVISFFLPHKERFKKVMFFFIQIIIPISLVLSASIIFKWAFIQRHFIWAIPLFIFLIGWSWEAIIVYFTEKFEKKLEFAR